MKYLLNFLIIFSTNLLASDAIVSTLPTENLSFDIVNNHTQEELVKDQFETSEEFNKRKQKLSVPNPISIYINEVLYYDADKEEYSFRCYEGYNEDYATKLLKDETNLIPRSGNNGFGAEWDWSEKVGRIYELRYKCPENRSIQVPLVDAKEFRDDFIAVIELELTAQNWSSKTNYESAEFGKRIVNNYSTNFKNSNITAIHFGHKSSSLLYKKITDTVSDQPPKIKPAVKITPQYPRRAMRGGIEGYVELSFAVTKTGSVEDIKVLASEPKGFFERAAIRALEKYKYKPLVVNGEPTKQIELRERIDFNLDNK